MSMNRADAAVHLGMTIGAFDDLMSDPKMMEAWIRGRAQITATVHAKLIEQGLAGNVTALKEVLRRLDMTRDELAIVASGAEDRTAAPDDARATKRTPDGPLRITDFASEFAETMRRKRGGAGGIGGAAG